MAKLNMKRQMANVDRAVMKHIRKHGALHYMDLLSTPWFNALERLAKRGELKCTRGYYDIPRITGATINAELKRQGIAERLVQGRGYIYFVDGDAFNWYSQSIAICTIAQIVVPGSLKATVARVLEERTYLMNMR